MSKLSQIDQRLHDFQLDSERNQHINCIVRDLTDRAIQKSKKNLYKDKEGLLFGKTFAIKDNINIKGYPTTCASNILRNHNSVYTATAVKRIEDEGGLVVAKTNLDEFAMGSSNEYSIFGPTKNPHNNEYVCGGSSGGSAGIVAAKIVDVALGSDTGGSVRQPASFCGVYGLKPTYGRISRYGLTAFASSFDQVGLFSNDLGDLIDSFSVVSGKDTRDSTSSDIQVDAFEYSAKKVKEIKIGVPKEYIDDSVDKEVKEKLELTINFLKKNDFNVKEISLPFTSKAISVYYILSTAEAASNLSRYDGVRYGYRNRSENVKEMYKTTRSLGFGDEVKRRIILGTFVLSSGYYDAFYGKALKVRRLIKNDFIKAFKNIDLILTPTSPYLPFKIGEKINDPIKMYLSDIYTVPMSLAGLPAINMPAGFSKNNLPIGLQLTANQFKENNIFSLCKFISENCEY